MILDLFFPASKKAGDNYADTDQYENPVSDRSGCPFERNVMEPLPRIRDRNGNHDDSPESFLPFWPSPKVGIDERHLEGS